MWRLGVLEDSTLVVRQILTYRRRLVASPEYLASRKPPKKPSDLLEHRLLSFSHWKRESSWDFIHLNGTSRERLSFQP